MIEGSNFKLLWFISMLCVRVVLGRVLGLTSTRQKIKCLTQRHNTVPLVRLKPATTPSQIEHSTTERMRSSLFSELSQDK